MGANEATFDQVELVKEGRVLCIACVVMDTDIKRDMTCVVSLGKGGGVKQSKLPLSNDDTQVIRDNCCWWPPC